MITVPRTQSESELEESLIKRLSQLGYERVKIKNEQDLLANLKQQLEKHYYNARQLKGVPLSDREFKAILNHLDRGSIYERAKTLRDKYPLERDTGEKIHIEFLNLEEWCQNEYQVTNQVTIGEGTYTNRYDVTLLINGLPLVHIELKRRGLELKKAFNQINRYQRHSFWAGTALFQYVQLFVISNGVNTKYFANSKKPSFKQTFYWADEDNNRITQLDQFADLFLEKCHISKMICKYMVLQEAEQFLMVLRPYQYYAVERLVAQVRYSRGNGYIWHTTGSGKTLTSFKAAQIIKDMPGVDKVLFVVDRADLDTQTIREFNSFQKGSVDPTNDTKSLIRQLRSVGNAPIVTTIQKLNNAINNERHLSQMAPLRENKIVFIFDECHRSQFGKTHNSIKSFFKNHQMFGFTGTPILEENAAQTEEGRKTTKNLFDRCLHRYLITNAIGDGNVLKFSIEYWGRLRLRDGAANDQQVQSINTKEFFENPERIESIIDWIIQNHKIKTHNKTFTAMLAVSSVNALIKYYQIFKAQKKAGKHDLRIATIFTYGADEDDRPNDNGTIRSARLTGNFEGEVGQHSREVLDQCIADYNKMYGTAFSTKVQDGFYGYYKDLGKRIKDREKSDFKEENRIDILLVVSMFLTGFDAKKVNTLYVDKNLKYHGLIQAFSRTNRILDEVKSQGNIVCFRNLKSNTDDAVRLFSDANASEDILIEPYENYVGKFNETVEELKKIAPTVNCVNQFEREEEIVHFVKTFRQLIRLMNVLTSFSEFNFDNLSLKEQEFADYQSKYLDIKNETSKEEGEKVSIIDDIDFELELIHRDDINVSYILDLLGQMLQEKQKASVDEEKILERKKSIDILLNSEPSLRDKRDLILKFISSSMPSITNREDIKNHFRQFWNTERTIALQEFCQTEEIEDKKLKKLIEDYKFSGLVPSGQDIVQCRTQQPGILERETVIKRITNKLINFIQKFDDYTGDI